VIGFEIVRDPLHRVCHAADLGGKQVLLICGKTANLVGRLRQLLLGLTGELFDLSGRLRSYFPSDILRFVGDGPCVARQPVLAGKLFGRRGRRINPRFGSTGHALISFGATRVDALRGIRKQGR
jgi:hypothetical protein